MTRARWERSSVEERGIVYHDHTWGPYRIATGYGHEWTLYRGGRYVQDFELLSAAKKHAEAEAARIGEASAGT